MLDLKHVIGEVHRRSLWQVLGLYGMVAWVSLQVVQQVTESVGLPDWVPGAAVVLLIIGFPIILATAFIAGTLPQAAAHGSQSVPSPEPGSAPASLPEPAPAEDSLFASTQAASASEAAQAAPAASRSDRPGAHHRLFTWKHAFIGGAAAFAFLGLATAGWMAMRTMGIGPAGTLVAKGLLADRSTIILSQFESEDASLARAATEAFRIDLSQSEVVKLAEPSFVSAALERAERPADEKLDLALAREIAQREGVPAVLGGEINRAGSRYVLSAELVSAQSGEVLASHRETAADSSAVVEAIDRLSRKLRERIGESLRSIAADPPLERVTTSSLEALRLYSEAVQTSEVQGNDQRAIGLLEEVVAADTAFGMAWRKLGVLLLNRREDRARGVEALTRAFTLRDRLTKRERYWATASYYQQGTREPEKAIPAYENLLELDPTDSRVLNNLGVAYGQLKDEKRAEEYYLRAVQADTASAGLSLSNVILTQAELGKLEEAEASLERYAQLAPADPNVEVRAAELAYVRGDVAGARQRFQTLRREMTGNLFWRSTTSEALASLAASRGKLAEAQAHRADAEAADRERELSSAALGDALVVAWTDLWVREDSDRARSTLKAALARYPLADMDPLDRPYRQLAGLYAWAGSPERGRSLLEAYEAEVPEELRREPHAAEGAVALAEGRYDDAIAQFRAWEKDTQCRICALPALAHAYVAAGRRDSAIALSERYVGSTSMFRLYWDDTVLGPTLERLARLYDEAGDLENAAKYYAKFVEVWAEADEELQPRVRAAQKRLEEIVRERG